MKTKIIAMLVNNDVTVENALEIFKSNTHKSIKCWGFKDIGISKEDAVDLVKAMKKAGRTTFYEPLIEDEKECIKEAQFAIECKFDYHIGNVFHKSVCDLLKDSGVKYFPTCGNRAGTPRMLYGTIDSVLDDAKRIVGHGADGVCLSVYRYKDGKPEVLAKRFKKEFTAPFIVTGSIGDNQRLDFIKDLKPWGFTVGTALFKDNFGGNNTIYEKLDNIKNYLNK